MCDHDLRACGFHGEDVERSEGDNVERVASEGPSGMARLGRGRPLWGVLMLFAVRPIR